MASYRSTGGNAALANLIPVPGLRFVPKSIRSSATSSVSTKAANLARNAAKGKNFEQKVANGMKKNYKNVQKQITVRTKSGMRTRIDTVGTRRGKAQLVEAKSSQGARLTSNQKKAFAEIEKSGGTVVGKGKPGYEGGTVIEPQKVKIIRGNQ